MVFHIAVCSPDAGLRSGLERQCMEYFARRQDACIVQQLPDADALLRRDTEGERFDLYLIELGAVAAPAGLSAAAELRRRGRRAPLAFVARTTAHAYSAYKVDALQYLLLPVRQRELSALLARATEPEYGPSVTVNTAEGLRALPYLLADGRFLQPHRSYVVNLAEADLLSAGELRMRSGARISIPRGREGAVRDAFQQWVQQQKYSLK